MRAILASVPVALLLIMAILSPLLLETSVVYSSVPKEVTDETSLDNSPSNSNVTNSNVTNSNITNSNITNSNITDLNITNSRPETGQEENDSAEETNPNENEEKNGSAEETKPQDGILQIQIVIDNQCDPKRLCSDINSNNLFRVVVFNKDPDNFAVMNPTQTDEEGRSYVKFPLLEKNEIVKYYVTQTRQNFVLQPWYVAAIEEEGACPNSTISAGENKLCVIKIKVAYKNSEDFGIGYLYVKTNITNDCYPVNVCDGLRASNIFSDHISTLKGSSYEEELRIPGSEMGWNISFHLSHNESLIQYNVDQSGVKNKDARYKPSDVAYTPDCQGTIRIGDNKICTISNTFGQGNLNIAKLKVITQIETNETCQSGDVCTKIRAGDFFSDHVSTFNYNEYEKEYEFPASEGGWIVDFFPSRDGGGFIQYDVSQTINDQKGYRASGSWDVIYSRGCHGFMQAGENKTCIIKNIWMKQPITAQQLSDYE